MSPLDLDGLRAAVRAMAEKGTESGARMELAAAAVEAYHDAVGSRPEQVPEQVLISMPDGTSRWAHLPFIPRMGDRVRVGDQNDFEVAAVLWDLQALTQLDGRLGLTVPSVILAEVFRPLTRLDAARRAVATAFGPEHDVRLVTRVVDDESFDFWEIEGDVSNNDDWERILRTYVAFGELADAHGLDRRYTGFTLSKGDQDDPKEAA